MYFAAKEKQINKLYDTKWNCLQIQLNVEGTPEEEAELDRLEDLEFEYMCEAYELLHLYAEGTTIR